MLLFLMVSIVTEITSLAAEKGYLEAKDYISSSSTDVSSEVSDFLKLCKARGVDAFFNQGVYPITGTVSLANGVSMIGEEGTIFQGTGLEYQSYLRDNAENVKSITIENIIFDNVTIYFQSYGSTDITIQNNIFLNAKKVDLNVNNGLKPDSSNKNGGESTGYYILKNHNKIDIISNLFFRDSSSLGRGIGLYKTQNAVIQDNYFGMLEDIDQSIVSAKTKALKQSVLSSGLLKQSSDQGHFMTGINVINSDINTKIIGNAMSFNKDIIEAGYEDGSQSTNGYNRDHFIYAKMFDGLDIVGNSFKGMNKNQDGAIKCRNGENLLIYKNILIDSLILLYVQNAQTNLFLRNVVVQENIFINKDYSTELIQIPSGDNVLNKYITIDYLILLKNYEESAELTNISFVDNVIYSADLKNEQIRVDNTGFAMPSNLTIQGNENLLHSNTRITIRNTLNSENIDQTTDFSNGVAYSCDIAEEYLAIKIENLAEQQEIPFQIKDGRLVSSAEDMYIDGLPYTNQTLSEEREYLLFLSKATTSTVSVEGVEYQVPSHLYTVCKISIPKENTYSITFERNGHGLQPEALNQANALPEALPVLEEEGHIFKGWYLDEQFLNKAQGGTEISSDTILFAKWEIETYKISFMDGTTRLIEVQIPYLQQLNQPEAPTKEGYNFLGWSMKETEFIEYDFKNAVKQEFSLYAHWQIKKFNIVFMLNRTDMFSSIEAEYGQRIVKPNDPVQKGYRFEGWYEDLNVNTAFDFSTPITQPTTLYAKWDIEEYVVTFKIANEEVAQQLVRYDGCVQAPNISIEEGYILEGWYKTEELNEPFDFTLEKVQEDICLYGKLKKVVYTIAYDVQGHGTPVEAIKNATTLPLQLPSLSEPGYIFLGWYLDRECTTQAAPGTKISSDITLYANWKKIEVYTVAFYLIGTGEVAKISIEDGDLAVRPDDLTLEGYRFDAWYLDEACTEQWDFAEDRVTANQTLYARWVELPSQESSPSIMVMSIAFSTLAVVLVGIGGLVFFLKKRK